MWGPAYVEHDHYVRVHMGHLRQKLEDDPAQPAYLLTGLSAGRMSFFHRLYTQAHKLDAIFTGARVAFR